MAGDVIRVAVTTFPPWATFVNSTVHRGDAFDFWEYVARSLNLSYRYVYVDKLEFAGRTDNGSWPGIFGFLHREVADVLLLPIYVTDDRFEDFRFSAPFSFVYSVILTGPPGAHSDLMSAFITFDYQVLSAIAIAIGLLVCMTKLEQKLPTTDRIDANSDVVSLTFQLFGSLLLKPISMVPRSVAGRMALGLWMLSLIVISNMYMSVMKAQFVMPQLMSIDTFNQLLQRTDYKVLLLPAAYFFRAFKDAKDPVLVEIYQRSLLYRHPYQMSEELDLYPVVCRERIALVEAYANILTALDQVCADYTRTGMRFVVSGRQYFFTSSSLAFRKSFPAEIIEKISLRTLHFLETNLDKIVFDKSHKTAQKCISGSAPSQIKVLRALALADVAVVFMMLMLWLGVTILIFLAELIISLRIKKTMEKYAAVGLTRLKLHRKASTKDRSQKISVIQG